MNGAFAGVGAVPEAGPRGAGMLTNCSLTNSFNLHGKHRVGRSPKAKSQEVEALLFWFWKIGSVLNYDAYSDVKVGTPDATVIRSCVLSAGSVSILIWKWQ